MPAPQFPFIHGLVSAVHTPFHEDGSLNLDVVPQQVEHLVKHKMAGAFVCGTTGESLLLTGDERRTVAERWVELAPDELRVIVHVGHTSQLEAMGLAEHAQQIGAAAISTMPPTFFRPSNVEQLIEYCCFVSAAAPELPFYYYHIPSMTGVNLSVAEFLAEAAEQIPTLAGVKFTDNNLFELGKAMDVADGRFQLLFGLDEMLLGALALGVVGGVGGTYALAPHVYQNLLSAFDAGDWEKARHWQAASRKLVSMILEIGVIPATKAGMRVHGIDCGPVRAPLDDATPEQFERIAEVIGDL